MQPMNDAMIQEVTGLFGALGDQSRLKILRTLLEAGAPLNQGKLAEAAGLSQANASKHLACLVRVGLVARKPEGNAVLFSPILPLVSELCELVCSHVSERAQHNFNSLNG